MSIFSVTFVLIIFSYSIYLIWAATKISLRQDENFYRIEDFEENLILDTHEYECLFIYEGAVSSKKDYIEVRDKIIESPKFEFKYFLPIHYLGVFFSLAVNEESQIIYVAIGSDTYDWNSTESPLVPQSGESTNS
jgi:hypothetical protein